MVCATLAATTLGGCKGCSKQTDSVPSELTPAEEIHAVLEQPQKMDERSIEELAQLVGGNVDISPAEVANMMIQAEAVSNRVSMEVERLLQVEDPADTYWSLKEISEAQWWLAYKSVYEWLGQAQLPDEIATRYGMLQEANKRVNKNISTLEVRDLESEDLINI